MTESSRAHINPHWDSPSRVIPTDPLAQCRYWDSEPVADPDGYWQCGDCPECNQGEPVEITKFVSAYIEIEALDEDGKRIIVQSHYEDSRDEANPSDLIVSQDRHIREASDPFADYVRMEPTGLQDVTFSLKNVRLGRVPSEA